MKNYNAVIMAFLTFCTFFSLPSAYAEVIINKKYFSNTDALRELKHLLQGDGLDKDVALRSIIASYEKINMSECMPEIMAIAAADWGGDKVNWTQFISEIGTNENPLNNPVFLNLSNQAQALAIASVYGNENVLILLSKMREANDGYSKILYQATQEATSSILKGLSGGPERFFIDGKSLDEASAIKKVEQLLNKNEDIVRLKKALKSLSVANGGKLLKNNRIFDKLIDVCINLNKVSNLPEVDRTEIQEQIVVLLSESGNTKANKALLELRLKVPDLKEVIGESINK